MSNTTSPTILPARPKRAPGVKRLNAVPKAIAFGVVIIFCGGVVYTAIQRSHHAKVEAAKEEDAKKVEGGTPPAFLNAAQTHGEVQAMLDRQASRPKPTPVAARPLAEISTPTIVDTSGSDAAEQARTRAWQAYFQQRDALASRRFEMDMRAMTGGDAQGGNGQANGLQPPNAPSGTGSLAQSVVAPGSPSNSQYATGGVDPSGQTGKQAFLKTPGDVYGLNEDLPGSVHGPKPDTIMEGTPIPGRLVDAATSDSPGQLTAEVSTNVCDSMTGQDLLIPQGTRIVTTYDTAVSAGQNRMGTIAQRLIFPDTSSRQLGSMEIADQSGEAGLKDVLNTHFWDKFWATALISLAGAGAQLAQPQQSAFSGYSPQSVGIGSMTQGFNQLGQAYAQRGLSIPNTIELRSGLPLVIKPNHDIPLPPYHDARGFTNGRGPCT